jgi:hypothetical protein
VIAELPTRVTGLFRGADNRAVRLLRVHRTGHGSVDDAGSDRRDPPQIAWRPNLSKDRWPAVAPQELHVRAIDRSSTKPCLRGALRVALLPSVGAQRTAPATFGGSLP